MSFLIPLNLSSTQKTYLCRNLDLVANLSTWFEKVGKWDVVARACRPGSYRSGECSFMLSVDLANAQEGQATALDYLIRSGADRETQKSLAVAAECYREVGSLGEQLKRLRCSPENPRRAAMTKQLSEVKKKALAARDLYYRWARQDAARQP